MNFAVLACMAVLVGYLLGFLAEQRVHKSNYTYLLHFGAFEHGSRTVDWYYRAHLLLITAAVGEFFFSGFPEPDMSFGLPLIFVGFFMRYFAILSKGRMWTRTIVLFQHEVIGGEPRLYRFLKRPDFIGRFFEVLGIALFLKSMMTASIGVLLIPTLSMLVFRKERAIRLEKLIKSS